MSDVLERIGGLFVAPAPRASLGGAAVTAPMSVALLCAPRDALAVGSALGLILARWHRAPCALVCVWPASAIRGGFAFLATRHARRLASSLTAHDLAASTAGRLARVGLAVDPEDAAREAVRAASVAGVLPIVLVMAGPRHRALDGLLSEHDAVASVAGPDGGQPQMRVLLAASLTALHRDASALHIPAGPAAALAACAGLAATGSLRRALEPVTAAQRMSRR